MAYIKMTNYAGQIFKDMNISAPIGAKVFDLEANQWTCLTQETHFKTLGNNRIGIGRYRINMQDSSGKRYYCMNFMMDDENRPGHKVWTLLDQPYTPEMIYAKYGYRVAPDGTRLKKYKLSGRVRTLKIAKELRDLGRFDDADRIIAEMRDTIAQGKRYMIYRQDLGLK